MGLKNIDFKQLFLQKGERIALVICLAIMGLLLVIYGISSVVSAGPQSHTEEIDRLRAVADSSWRSSQPTPGLGTFRMISRSRSAKKSMRICTPARSFIFSSWNGKIRNGAFPWCWRRMNSRQT